MACTGRDEHSQKNESKGKIGASFRKMIPECLSGGPLKCVSEALCGSSDNVPSQQEASSNSAPSEASLKSAFGKISLEPQMQGYDNGLESVPESVVALSVHGWARGHERKVVDTIKRQLHSSQVTIHEIVSPADILLMFHDMTMGLNAEHLLGRMRHAAAYSGAKQVLLVLMNSENPQGTKGAPSTLSSVQKAKGGRKVSEQSSAILESAASLVVEYTFDVSSGARPAGARNGQSITRIIDYIMAWVQGRNCVGISVESSQRPQGAGQNLTRVPAISSSLGHRLMGLSGSGKVSLPMASLSAARTLDRDTRQAQPHKSNSVRRSGVAGSRASAMSSKKNHSYPPPGEKPLTGLIDGKERRRRTQGSACETKYPEPDSACSQGSIRAHLSNGSIVQEFQQLPGDSIKVSKQTIHIPALESETSNYQRKRDTKCSEESIESMVCRTPLPVDLSSGHLTIDELVSTIHKDREGKESCTIISHKGSKSSSKSSSSSSSIAATPLCLHDRGDAFEININ